MISLATIFFQLVVHSVVRAYALVHFLRIKRHFSCGTPKDRLADLGLGTLLANSPRGEGGMGFGVLA